MRHLSEDRTGTSLERLPQHVGIIMDGNGRWARERGLRREQGHSKGADSVREVVRASRRIGLKALTLFAFSSQNWDRPPREVFHLMHLLRRYLIEERAEILDNDIRLVTVGETERLPRMVLRPLAELIKASSRNRGMTLCLALSYGGRETIAAAAKDLARAVARGDIDPDDIDPDLFGRYLPSSSLLPSLDLLIRTSGERRVSNFFLWEVAYAELYFSPVMWPDFGEPELHAALREYGKRERRFGLTPEQLAGVDAATPHISPAPRGPSALEALEALDALGDPMPETG
ncbi:Ditrans,polycis-undecaprenyl-diphosphate synthase [Enhygromyxa salina]|uniref:Isoprenyl transferase n=1 Tax=Enhygromyxa salina TaxID=215803 RepID=A0A2S9XGK9_9BACT|nr:polyprenyl diphosphate synthase [Enhygromyxa salina]PRP91890.1 Ditrans,polycis-undecaprenyl-diphosphate synthase [Enhygromyxa salina]